MVSGATGLESWVSLFIWHFLANVGGEGYYYTIDTRRCVWQEGEEIFMAALAGKVCASFVAVKKQ